MTSVLAAPSFKNFTIGLAGLFFAVALLCIAIPTAKAAVSIDANGWTVVTPSADTHKIYVSSSMGNDNNDGLSEATPKRTLAAGAALLRSGHPDWLLLKKGDTWTGNVEFGELFGGYQGIKGFMGHSADEPMLISSYGTGARPLIQAWSSNREGGNIIGSSPSDPNRYIDYLAIIGLEFYAYKSDPNNAAFDPVLGSTIRGIAVGNQYHWFLMEDCKTRFLGNSFSWYGALLLRRNVIVDNFGMGLYTEANSSVLLEENIFDHNGWSENPIAHVPRDIFRHNVYGAHTLGYDETIIYKGNISANGSDAGLRSRQGGLMDNNLLVQNGYGFDYGAGNLGAGPYPSSVGTNALRNNVILFQADYTVGRLGLSIASIMQSISVTNNFMGMATPGSVDTGDIILTKDAHNVVVSKNVLLDSGGGGWVVSDSGTGNTIASDNVTYTAANIRTKGFADPTRTLSTYDSMVLGGPGTVAHFISLARSQSKDTWDVRLTAETVNEWIRAGYGMTVVGYPYGGTPTPVPVTPPADTTAPSTPANLSGVPATASVALSWSRSSDNVGIVGYKVYRNGALVGIALTPAYTDLNLTSGTAYSYSVSAYDAAGNNSAQSNTLSITTTVVVVPTPIPVPPPVIPIPAVVPPPVVSIPTVVTTTPSAAFSFILGQKVKTTAKLNIRSSATTSGKPLGSQKKGAQGTIVAGPAVAEGVIWWKVDFASGVDGYVDQHYLAMSVSVVPQGISQFLTDYSDEFNQNLAAVITAPYKAAVDILTNLFVMFDTWITSTTPSASAASSTKVVVVPPQVVPPPSSPAVAAAIAASMPSTEVPDVAGLMAAAVTAPWQAAVGSLSQIFYAAGVY